MDAEWRPNDQSCKPAILQLSDESQAFIIDFKSLQNSRPLDLALSSLFQQRHTVCIGFSFSGDLKNFSKHFPEMTFFRKFERFIDL